MRFAIRPFADSDYPALCAIIADVFDQLFTPESLRDEEARRDPKCRHEAWVAEVDGQVVAFADFNQWIGAYHPRKFSVMVAVLPAYRRQGIGGALYNRLREALAPTDPIALSCDAKESRPESIRFLERRGFAEKMRSWESRLDLTAFDPSAFAATVDAAGARGYEFLPLTAVRDLPDYARQIYKMLSVARRDVPTVQAQTEIPFEQWIKSLSRPHLLRLSLSGNQRRTTKRFCMHETWRSERGHATDQQGKTKHLGLQALFCLGVPVEMPGFVEPPRLWGFVLSLN